MAGTATPNTTKARKAALIAALHRTLGVVTPACELVGCSREIYYVWMKSDEDFKAEVEAIGEKLLDFGESKFLQAMENGEVAAIVHFMKTKGRKRGYAEDKTPALPPAPEDSGRKLIIMSLRRRNQDPPPAPPTSDNLPAIIP